MSEDAQAIAAEVALRNDEIREKISQLMDNQDRLQDDILELQRRKRNGEDIDEDRLRELKEARKETGRMAGILASERTELLDDLPVIRTATGKLEVVAAELAEDATLLDRATARLKQVTKTLQTVEKLAIKIAGLFA
jgi:hypothetical protein